MTNADVAPTESRPLPVIKVVGVSAAGKSTLVAALRSAGYDARPVSQEHASVPDLWRQFDVPRALIFLDVSLEGQRARRDDVTWSDSARTQELQRLAHAREHADLVLDSSALAAEVVLTVALAWLAAENIRHADAPLAPIGATGAPLPPDGPHRRPTT